ncbi:hypothetical protein L228DRAFT_122460 [Xylona heveae TC161]|uniref:uS12 prolyl 3,4-dihydroxylase n=1 Tax=Xylona heveae (strain CBS 132557 / TC161) TaxID=1328760 RepID=A0A165HLD8_XYLHT|nr:hypothetical protein L228DRAFT_122460 [Xylona heveae TC161]KZF23690.1 hypothetical protein L228DRAFT_122460 [Xylona heveae TC161]
MKRKADDTKALNGANGGPLPKKRVIDDETARKNFRNGLFDEKVLQDYTKQYANSSPYKHGVISDLIQPELLRRVRNEIQENVSFTPKETDIYKIHQSGDLANLDGLDDSSLKLLPSLLELRESLYSSAFRSYLSRLTGSGPLSGQKTDMAINVYTPGCHLLCHDDVIGSRRISYILYLTDPDHPWKAEWGGALQMFPTEKHVDEDGTETRTPLPDYDLKIPPAFSQLSFFVVQPGQSFHDVEEVYPKPEGDEEDDGGRIRMAISGWFHIPQEGEEGFIPGLEQQLAEKSSLVQLSKKADKFDYPKEIIRSYADAAQTEKAEKEAKRQAEAADKGKGKGKKAQADEDEDEDDVDDELTEKELDFLLKFLAPTYLTPDTLEELSELFAEESSLRLDKFLSNKFSARLREYIEAEEKKTLPEQSKDIETQTPWKVARPPHKHRFLYQQQAKPSEGGTSSSASARSPINELLEDLLPSHAFKKWLGMATGLEPETYGVLARRFRRGLDYTLATDYQQDRARLEVTLDMTPTPGWGDDEASPTNAVEDGKEAQGAGAGEAETAESSKDNAPSKKEEEENDDDDENEEKDGDDAAAHAPEPEIGGYEVYMAGDDDAAGDDPAVYRAAGGPDGDDEDDGVLFSQPAGWNRLSIVLRDTGVLKFVKYVSRAARGDRWDISGMFSVKDEDGDDDDDDDEEEDGEEGGDEE